MWIQIVRAAHGIRLYSLTTLDLVVDVYAKLKHFGANDKTAGYIIVSSITDWPLHALRIISIKPFVLLLLLPSQCAQTMQKTEL